MARFLVTFRDGTPPAEVSVGAFSQIAAKRRYGVQAVAGETADPEAGIFAVFVELVGPQKAADVEAFDTWLMTVEDFEPASAPAENGDGDEDHPTPAESSASSPASPPT